MARTFRVQEPIASYVAEEDRIEAKLFANGRSQAIRLPKEFRMPGDRVLIHREGKRLIVEPMEELERDAKGHPLGFFDEMQALAADLSEEDWRTFDAVVDDDPVPPAIADEDHRGEV